MTNSETIDILSRVLERANEEIEADASRTAFLCYIAKELFGRSAELMIQDLLFRDGIKRDGSGFAIDHPIWLNVPVSEFLTTEDKNRRRICWLEHQIYLLKD